MTGSNDIVIELNNTFTRCTCGGQIRIRTEGTENDITVEHDNKMCDMGRTITKGIFQLVHSEAKN